MTWKQAFHKRGRQLRRVESRHAQRIRNAKIRARASATPASVLAWLRESSHSRCLREREMAAVFARFEMFL